MQALSQGFVFRRTVWTLWRKIDIIWRQTPPSQYRLPKKLSDCGNEDKHTSLRITSNTEMIAYKNGTNGCSDITFVWVRGKFKIEYDKTNIMTCAPSEDSDQPGHPPSLIRVFAVRMKKPWVFSYPLSAQRRSDQPGRTGQMRPAAEVYFMIEYLYILLEYF